MAHADYNCCAVCDSKMDYVGFNSRTKENICTYCLKRLRDLGLSILDVGELKAHMVKLSPDELKEFVVKSGMSRCFYPNIVDEIAFPKEATDER